MPGWSARRPYDLRHAFASLLIAEGRLSIVEIAAQLGHNPTVCLDIYGHEMAERAGGGVASAESLIYDARRACRSTIATFGAWLTCHPATSATEPPRYSDESRPASGSRSASTGAR